MPKFVIEREIPGAGKLSGQELHAISQKSCGVLQTMGPKIQWLQSYVTDDKIYCVYIAPAPPLTPVAEAPAPPRQTVSAGPVAADGGDGSEAVDWLLRNSRRR